jgi:hypothetical protein
MPKLPPIPDGYQLEGRPWEEFQQGPWTEFQKANPSSTPKKPVFQFLGPDGQTHSIEGPEGSTPEQAFAILQQHLGPSKGERRDSFSVDPAQIKAARDAGYSDEEITGHLSQRYPEQFKNAADAGYSSTEMLDHLATTPVTASGLAKAAGTGALHGAVGLPGDFVSLINLARKGYQRLTGGDYDASKDDYSLGQTYNDVVDKTDKLYEPKNTAESITKGIAEYAPALVGGPESIAGKGALDVAKILAKRAVNQAAVPAAASEVAGYATKGTEAEPYARVAAALLAAKGTSPKAPSVDTARAATNAAYDTARNAGVAYDPNALAARATAAKADLQRRGISEKSAPSSHDTLDSFINNNSPMSLTDLEEQRQLIGKDLSKGGKEAVAAAKVKGVIDDIMSRPANAVAGADPVAAYAALQKARKLSQATNRLSDIEDLQDKAATFTNVHGTEPTKALQMQFGSALRNSDVNDPAMRSQMESISKGAFPQAIARRLGGGDLSKWRLLELSALAFPAAVPFVVGSRLAGYGLSKVVDARMMAKIGALKAMVASQAGLPVTPGSSALRTRALLGALAANQTSQSPP